MKFISSVCWVPKGKSKTPTQLKIEKNEMKRMFAKNNGKFGADNSDEENDQSDKEEDIDKKYNLDDYDNEDEEIRIENLNSLACFHSNAEDNLLTIKDDGEDSDEEDFKIRSDDNLLLAGHFDEDVCSLNVYVYNSNDRHFYIHHDHMLPSYPICLEWLDYDPTESGAVNYLAIGSLNPWIEIWDLDLVDSLEPEFILGSMEKIKKKKDPTKKQKILGHRSAVLDLSWNRLNTTVLASGSADKSIILWDLKKLKKATRIKNHTGKVQSVQWHPIEAFSLLSGSADKTVALYDCRNPNTNKKTWSLEQEIEQVLWNNHDPNYFLCCDNVGNVNMIDIRMSEPVVKVVAHEAAVNAIAMSSSVPGLFVTGSDDQSVKIWDVKTDTIDLVFEKTLKLGEINTISAAPDTGFAFGIGGAKNNEPIVWDVQDVTEVRRHFYPRMNIPLELAAKPIEDKNPKEDKRTKRSKSYAEKQLTHKRKNRDYTNLNVPKKRN